MRRLGKLVIPCLLYALLWQGYWTGRAEAQFAALVHDPGVIMQIINQIAQTVELVQQGIDNLARLSNLGTISVILAHIEALLETAQDIMDDIVAIAANWNALTGTDQLPTTSIELFQWNSRANDLMLQGTRRAYAAMSLLRNVLQLLHDAQRLFLLIQSLGGTVASLQLIAGQMATLVSETVRAETLTAAYHQAMLAPVAVQSVNEIASDTLTRKRLEGYGSIGTYIDLRSAP